MMAKAVESNTTYGLHVRRERGHTMTNICHYTLHSGTCISNKPPSALVKDDLGPNADAAMGNMDEGCARGRRQLFFFPPEKARVVQCGGERDSEVFLHVEKAVSARWARRFYSELITPIAA